MSLIFSIISFLVPTNYSDKQLATWVVTQRSFKKSARLQIAHERRLNEVGFVWDPRDEYWEEMFGRMIAYKTQNGDCRVPRNYGDKQLAQWVTLQRTVKNTGELEPALEQRLNELGFSWDPIDEYWEEMFGKLVAYKQQYGDCRVLKTHRDKKFANWVQVQRRAKNRDKLVAGREQRLNELGFVWDVRRR